MASTVLDSLGSSPVFVCNDVGEGGSLLLVIMGKGIPSV